MNKANWIGTEIYHKELTGSTNQDVRELALQGAADGTVVYADMQTAGRGRRGRNWFSERGESLLFSLLLRPDISPDKASQITLLMALAVTRVLREDCGVEAMIKWPNDIVIGGKKICGILTELYPGADGKYFVIVGCGINVGQKEIPAKLRDIATSLCLESNHHSVIANGELLQGILAEFEHYYDRFLVCGSLADFVDEYNARLVSLDKEVRVLDPKGEYSGISKGINDKGELLVQLDDGNISEVYAGEVSVRGLYGYV